MKHNSHLTATHRKKPSSPAKLLHARGLLRGDVLDYGCGRGRDADEYGLYKYDPHYYPEIVHPQKSSVPDLFETVMCNYVLNTIPELQDRMDIIIDIYSKLRWNGWAYIAVRADATSLNGWTKRGTWQGDIRLGLALLHKDSNKRIYKVQRTE